MKSWHERNLHQNFVCWIRLETKWNHLVTSVLVTSSSTSISYYTTFFWHFGGSWASLAVFQQSALVQSTYYFTSYSFNYKTQPLSIALHTFVVVACLPSKQQKRCYLPRIFWWFFSLVMSLFLSMSHLFSLKKNKTRDYCAAKKSPPKHCAEGNWYMIAMRTPA